MKYERTNEKSSCGKGCDAFFAGMGSQDRHSQFVLRTIVENRFPRPHTSEVLTYGFTDFQNNLLYFDLLLKIFKFRLKAAVVQPWKKRIERGLHTKTITNIIFIIIIIIIVFIIESSQRDISMFSLNVGLTYVHLVSSCYSCPIRAPFMSMSCYSCPIRASSRR